MWVIVPYPNYKQPTVPDIDSTNPLDVFEREMLRLITADQGTADWFILRRFHITSTVALTAMKTYAQIASFTDTGDRLIQAYITLLGFTRSRNFTGPVAIAVMLAALIGCWFMKPIGKGKRGKSLTIGKRNEENVASHFGDFIECQGRANFRITERRAYGLVGSKKIEISKTQATSVDQVYLCTNEDGSNFIAAAEIKTKTNDQTVNEAEVLRETYGAYSYIVLDPISFDSANTWGLLKRLIPNQSYRLQCLHHGSTLGLNDIFYIEASGNESTCRIIRCVHIRVDSSILMIHAKACKEIENKYLQWIHNDSVPVPDIENYFMAQDRDGFLHDFKLWKALYLEIKRRGVPFPPFKHWLPKLAALHNIYKTGVDSHSRSLSTIKVRHEKMPTLTALMMRQVTEMWYNTFMLWRLIKTNDWLQSSACTSFRQWKKHANNECGSFKDFCGDLADEFTNSVVELSDPIEEVVDPATFPLSRTGNTTSKYKSLQVFLEGDGRDQRLTSNASVKHEEVLLPYKNGSSGPRERLRCILCCCTNGPAEQLKNHSRLGFQSSVKCSFCDVASCKRRRRSADLELIDVTNRENPRKSHAIMSCFELFHTVRELPDISRSKCHRQSVQHDPL